MQSRTSLSRARAFCACIASLALVAACKDVSGPTTPAPIVRAVAIDTTATGEILLEVTLDQPGSVQIDYWNDPSHKLRVVVSEDSSGTWIHLPRLQAGKQYQYEVSGLSPAGGEGQPMGGSVSVPPLPPDLASVSFSATGAPSAPVTMLEVNAAFNGFVAVDGDGHVVWWFRTVGQPQGFTRRANGNFVLNDALNRLVEVSPSGTVIRELVADASGKLAAHHDVIATPQNTLLFLTQEQRAVGDSLLVGDAIYEWAPESGDVVRRWTAFDFYDPALDVGIRSKASDWVHANSLAMGDHGNVILSLNWLDQVVSIAPDWKSLEWKLGGRGSSFLVDADAAFQGQHTAARLENGHVLVFDNGRDRAAPARYSRGVELTLDPVAHTAKRVWDFSPSPAIYAPYVGAARRLANGNTLVFFGLPSTFVGATGPISGYEVRPDGSVAWRIVVGGASMVYRATPLQSLSGEAEVR